jgi:hypothetical protein
MGKSITDLSSVTTVGLDLAKHVFQVHGVDASGRVIVARAFRRKDVLASRARRRRFVHERLRKDPSLAKLSCNSKHSQAYGNPSMFLNRDLHHYLLKPQPKS